MTLHVHVILFICYMCISLYTTLLILYIYSIHLFNWGLPSAQGIIWFSSHNIIIHNSNMKWMYITMWLLICKYTCNRLLVGYWLYFVVLYMWHCQINIILHTSLCVGDIYFNNVKYVKVFIHTFRCVPISNNICDMVPVGFCCWDGYLVWDNG